VTLAPIAVAVGAVAQAVTGLGFSLVCAPALIASLGRLEGVRLNLLLSSALNLALLLAERRDTNWSYAGILLLPAVIATPLFAFAFDRIDKQALAVAAGVVTILMAIALALGGRMHRARGRLGAAVAGVVSAATNILAGIGGPPIAMYAVNAEWPAVTVRPTLQAYFLGLNAIGLAVLGLPHLELAPWIGLLIGWIGGLAVARRVPEGAARPLILLLAAVGGLAAILRARG
jgi:uncharacterized membrane protein YfcA